MSAYDGNYYFRFNGIGAQQMSDLIDSYVIITDSEGKETVVDSKLGYSVKENAQWLLTEYSDYEELV